MTGEPVLPGEVAVNESVTQSPTVRARIEKNDKCNFLKVSHIV